MKRVDTALTGAVECPVVRACLAQSVDEIGETGCVPPADGVGTLNRKKDRSLMRYLSRVINSHMESSIRCTLLGRKRKEKREKKGEQEVMCT